MNVSFITRHSSHILTGIAVTGVVATAVLSADAHVKAQQIRYSVDPESKTKTIWNATKARWKIYTPAVVTGVITIVSMIQNHRITARQIASLDTAFTVTKKAYENYRKATIKHTDPNTERKIAESAEAPTMTGTDATVLLGDGKVLCKDAYSGRFFESSVERIRAAVNNINQDILNQDTASLNDWYAEIGLDAVEAGDDLGWNTDHILDVLFGSTMSPDNRPAVVVSFTEKPVQGWWNGR